MKGRLSYHTLLAQQSHSFLFFGLLKHIKAAFSLGGMQEKTYMIDKHNYGELYKVQLVFCELLAEN